MLALIFHAEHCSMIITIDQKKKKKKQKKPQDRIQDGAPWHVTSKNIKFPLEGI